MRQLLAVMLSLLLPAAIVNLYATPQAQGPCASLGGPLNGQSPQCYGNLFDYNFYWNAATHAPKVQVRNLLEVPDGKSQWQARYGMDTHSLGGFSPEDYRQPAFAAEYPYKPAPSFAGIGKGKDLKDMPWRVESDYLGNPLGAGHRPSIGHVEYIAK